MGGVGISRPFDRVVNRGARLLDKARPEWWKRIDVPTLRMYSCEKCILGQEYSGDVIHVEDEIPGYWIGGMELGVCGEEPKYGFSDLKDRWTSLRSAWVRLIKSRYRDAAKGMK